VTFQESLEKHEFFGKNITRERSITYILCVGTWRRLAPIRLKNLYDKHVFLHPGSEKLKIED
jgi:hypothetical protein